MEITVYAQNRVEKRQVESGVTLLDALFGYRIHTPCGGKGTCKKCTVLLENESGLQPVLACQVQAQDGMRVHLTEEKPLEVEIDGTESEAYVVDGGQTGYGIACDIGTTTVVCHMTSLENGKRLASVGRGNAQRAFGGDVIARIKAAEEGKLEVLQKTITTQLSEMILELCDQTGVPVEQVHGMSIAANTTMCHLLTGLNPAGLGRAPFTPVSRFGDRIDAAELNLPFNGKVYIAPAVSGYVGGDITADLLSVGMDQMDKPVLLIDVGTNGEMALGCGENFVCCSTAAGPAFEGAQIACGMTAAPGAISEVLWEDGELRCSVIGGGEAAGICGSGLIDAVAVMLQLGAVDETGRMLDADEDEDEITDEARPYLFLTDDEEPAFRLSEKVYISQADVRKLQLGKGAIAAGVSVLMKHLGLNFDGVNELLLAGGFGSYIRPASAARIGLIPAELESVTRAVGNAAAEGATMALLAQSARERLEKLQHNMNYLELSGLPAFNEAYMEAMMFPEEE